MPHISVIVPCYNAETFVRRSIESVLAQTAGDVEIIVIDDLSTDGTCDIVQELSARDPRVRLVRRDTNGGPGRARNMGIDAATGDWIAVLDADDWYDPQRLEILASEADAAGAVLVADNQYFIADGRELPWRLLRDGPGADNKKLTCDDLLRGDHPTRSRNLGLLKPMVRRDFLRDTKIRYDEEFGIGEDFYFLLKCVQRASYVLVVSKPMYYYRLHEHSLTKSLSSSKVIALRIYHKRCHELFEGIVPESTQTLMEARGREIESYIGYKLIVVALREGRIRQILVKIISNPTILVLLLRAVIFRTARNIIAMIPRRKL